MAPKMYAGALIISNNKPIVPTIVHLRGNKKIIFSFLRIGKIIPLDIIDIITKKNKYILVMCGKYQISSSIQFAIFAFHEKETIKKRIIEKYIKKLKKKNLNLSLSTKYFLKTKTNNRKIIKLTK